MADTNLTKIDLYETTLSTADMSNINENAQYNIKDMPIGGITNAEMVLALSPATQGIFRVGSVYMCTDTVENQYTEKHYYKFTGIAWEDVSIGVATYYNLGLVKLGDDTVVTQTFLAPSTMLNRQYPIQANSEGRLSVNVPWTDTTYSNNPASSGGTTLSLVTTGEKYTWNNKANKSTIVEYTLLAANWSNNTYTLSVTGKTYSNNATVSNSNSGTNADVLANSEAIVDANIYKITDNGTSLTFVCETTPTVDLKIQVEVWE